MPLDNLVNTDIIMGYKPPDLSGLDPARIASNVLSIRNARLQQQTNALALQKAQQEAADQQILQNAYGSQDPTNYLLGLGRTDLAQTVQAQQRKEEGDKLDFRTKEQDLEDKRRAASIEIIKAMAPSRLVALQGVNTPEEMIQWHLDNPEIHGTDKAPTTAQLQYTLAQEGGLEKAKAQSMQALQYIMGIKAPETKFFEQELGNKTQVISIDPTTNKATVVPGSVANIVQRPTASGTSTTPAKIGLSGDELRTAAVDVAANPSNIRLYTSYGAAGQAYKDAINNEIGKLKKETGMTDSDFVQARAWVKSAQSTLTNLAKQDALVSSFSQVAKFNGNRALELINQIDDTGVPLIEGYTRAVKKGAGSVDVAEFQSVMNTFQTEVARLLTSSPTMAGVVSDTARKELQQIAAGNMNAAQAKRVINRIFAEIDIKESGIRSAMDQARAGTSVFTNTPPAGAGAGAGGTPPATTKTVVRKGTAADGRKVVQYSDGSVEYAP